MAQKTPSYVLQAMASYPISVASLVRAIQHIEHGYPPHGVPRRDALLRELHATLDALHRDTNNLANTYNVALPPLD